jgi:two-component system response regulator AdeR
MAKEKIMIVDDDKEFLEELREILGLSGYKTIAINDSTSALNAARRIRPDIVILDLKMKRKTGFQIAEELKQFPETAHIPTIAITGFYAEKGKSTVIFDIYGIKDFLIKPFNPLDVIAKIEAVLKERNDAEGLLKSKFKDCF